MLAGRLVDQRVNHNCPTVLSFGGCKRAKSPFNCSISLPSRSYSARSSGVRVSSPSIRSQSIMARRSLMACSYSARTVLAASVSKSILARHRSNSSTGGPIGVVVRLSHPPFAIERPPFVDPFPPLPRLVPGQSAGSCHDTASVVCFCLDTIWIRIADMHPLTTKPTPRQNPTSVGAGMASSLGEIVSKIVSNGNSIQYASRKSFTVSSLRSNSVVEC